MNTGAGLLGKSVMSRKPLCVIFHLFVSTSCIVGWHLVNSMHSGVSLSLSSLFILGFSMLSRLVCFIFHILFNILLVASPACKTFYKLSLVLSTYTWRRGVTDHSGHLTNGYAFINVCQNVAIVRSRWEDPKKNLNNFAVLHQILTQLAPIDWPWRCASYSINLSSYNLGKLLKPKNCPLSKAYRHV